jgi:hypothetical protein
MTARHELQRWLEETTWVNEPDPYPWGDAVRYADGKPIGFDGAWDDDDVITLAEPEPRVAPAGWTLTGFGPELRPEQQQTLIDALYRVSPVFQRFCDALTEMVEELGRFFEQLGQAFGAPAPYEPQHAQHAHPRDARRCPAHGIAFQAGQCRRCQREQARTASRRTR